MGWGFNMEVLDLKQRSQEWLDVRAKYFTASEAPAMMNTSKHLTRNKLLDAKKGYVEQEKTGIVKKILESGHDAEDSARSIIEMELFIDLPPVVGIKEVDGLPLLASFDGFDSANLVFEHKLWNKTLAENVKNGLIEPMYYWQLEHQLLVSGASEALFVVSDGTEEKMERLYYTSLSERRRQLIAGWKQFAEDLKSHKLKPRTEKIEGSAELLPVVTYIMNGTDVSTNIADCLYAVERLAKEEMSRELETDQDFADKEALNKAVKKARAELKNTVQNVEGEFVSFAIFSETAKQLDSILQKMQSHGEKQVKQQKENIKNQMTQDRNVELGEYINKFSNKFPGSEYGLVQKIIGALDIDYAGAMKGKRNLESIRDALDGAVAKEKIRINEIMEVAISNYNYLQEKAQGLNFLLCDYAQLLSKCEEDFKNVVDSHILEHQEREKVRIDAEREKIRLEEERKAKVEADRAIAEESLLIPGDEIVIEDISAGKAIQPYQPLEEWPSQEEQDGSQELAKVCEKLAEAEYHIKLLTSR
jgi:putative phage-type endonuclease